jgi:4-amino-4-deoxychorismate lyase
MSLWIDGVVESRLSALDRGLNYGDGLFETMRLVDGAVRHLDRHLARLALGCERLGISHVDFAALNHEIASIARTQDDGALKLIVTRGSGPRGYRPIGTERPTRILSWSPPRLADASAATDGVRVRYCTTPASVNVALAGVKHLNRLDCVLARSEWSDTDIAEGLMRDSQGAIVGGTMSNVFAVRGETIVTPRIDRAGVNGIMRGIVIEAAHGAGLVVEEQVLTAADLAAAHELFLTNALIGIWPVRTLEDRQLKPGPITRHLQHMSQA